MDEGESFHVTRERFAHLSDLKRAAVGRMSSTVGDINVTAMLDSLDRHQHHASIARFIQHELGAEREKLALLHQKGSQQPTIEKPRCSTDRAVEIAAIQY